jgi:hypothetical protein
VKNAIDDIEELRRVGLQDVVGKAASDRVGFKKEGSLRAVVPLPSQLEL